MDNKIMGEKMTEQNDQIKKLTETFKEEKRVLFLTIRNLQDMDEAHKKVIGVLNRQLTELKSQIKKIEENHLNAGRKAGFDV
jgi:septal ring factor EnvC (AmiA/AmiB activator)